MFRKTGIYVAILVVILSTLVVLNGCKITAVGSGNLETREFDYRDFIEVEASWTFEVDISRGEQYRVSVTADDNLFEYLNVRKEGKALILGLKGAVVPLNITLKAVIVMPDLQELELDGASKGKISGFSSTNPLVIDVSGASSLNIDNLETGDLFLDVAGASRVSGSIESADCRFGISGASITELEGSGGDLQSDVSGASGAKLGDFAVADASVKVSGASNATINASGRLDADVSGASTLNYIGNPTLGEIEVSSGSKINKL
jgi:hypothetical protein